MSEASTGLLLEHHLKELKLGGFVRDYKRVSAECAQEGCDYAGFLLRWDRLGSGNPASWATRPANSEHESARESHHSTGRDAAAFFKASVPT